MIKYELIVCLTDKTWFIDTVEANDHDSEADVHEAYMENYSEKAKIAIAYIGTYYTEEIEN